MNLPLYILLNDTVTLVVLQATAIMCIAALIGAVFQTRAALRSCIYLSALFCTLVGPVVLLGCSMADCTVSLPLRVSLPTSPSAVLSKDAISVQPLNNRNLGTYSYSDVSTPIVTPKANTAGGTNLNAKFWLLALWGCGSFLYGLGIALSMLRIRRLLQSVRPIVGSQCSIAAKHAAANLGVTEYPRIGISNRIDSPVAVGLFGNAWVLIPSTCLEAMTQEQLVHVLTHEGAHVIRRDPLIRLIQRISLAFWWWNPIAHFLNSQLSRAREEVCDNAVLGRIEGDVYGMTLLELGKLISSKRGFAGSVGLFGSRWSLEHRIKGILNPRRNVMVRVNRTVSVCVIVSFIGAMLVTSVTRVYAQESRWRKRNEERRAKLEQFEHLSAAHKHLKYGGGNEELANLVGEHARKIAASLDIDYDEVLLRFRKQGDSRERVFFEDPNSVRGVETALKAFDASGDLRTAYTETFRERDVVGDTLKELVEEFHSLREDVEKLKKARSSKDDARDRQLAPALESDGNFSWLQHVYKGIR